MGAAESQQLTNQEIEGILGKPNGPYVLLELVRMGRIDAEVAVSAIEQSRRDPLIKRIALAVLNAISSR